MTRSSKKWKDGAGAPAASRQTESLANPVQLIAVVLSWLVPGFGHWLLGQRVRAVILGGLLLGFFWWGEVLAQGYAVTRKEHSFLFWFQAGNGLSTFAANWLQWGDLLPVSGSAGMIDRSVPIGLYTGILFTTLSGVMNVLLVVHIMDPRSWSPQSNRTGQGGAP